MKETQGSKQISRRDFLKIAGIAGAAVALGPVLNPLGALASESSQKTEKTAESKTTLSAAEFKGFSDVPATHPYYDAIMGMAKAEIIGGFTDGTFGPEKLVTRQQFSKMIVGTMGLVPTEQDASSFKDLQDDGALYPYHFVSKATKEGIIKGYADGTFGPDKNITRAQVDTMMIRAMQNLQPGRLATLPEGYQSRLGDFSPDHAPSLNIAEYNGLLNGLLGYGFFWDPFQSATRGEVAQMLWNSRNYEKQQETGANLVDVKQYDTQNLPQDLKNILPSTINKAAEIKAQHPGNASEDLLFYLLYELDGSNKSSNSSFAWKTEDASGSYNLRKYSPRFIVDNARFNTYLSFSYQPKENLFGALFQFRLWPKEGNESSNEYFSRVSGLINEINTNHADNGVIRAGEIKDILKQAVTGLGIQDPNNLSGGIAYEKAQGQGGAIDKIIDSL